MELSLQEWFVCVYVCAPCVVTQAAACMVILNSIEITVDSTTLSDHQLTGRTGVSRHFVGSGMDQLHILAK